jgi:hypothetical protein
MSSNWISAVRPVTRLAFEVHATPATSQGQQALSMEITAEMPADEQNLDDEQNKVEASVARCLRTPPDGA